MPIWKSINGSCSISLLEGYGKRFLILGEIHCSLGFKAKQLCLRSDRTDTPARLIEDLARFTPTFLDIYLEYSENIFWQTTSGLGGFLGKIGVRDSVDRTSISCTDFRWIHKDVPKLPKDYWEKKICLTSRWHYTDLRYFDQGQVEEILGLPNNQDSRYLVNYTK